MNRVLFIDELWFSLCYTFFMALIPFFKPALFRKDMDAVLQTMVDEKIGPGEKKRQFVKSFCSYLSLSDGVALRTYVDAIALSLHALGLQEGDKVALSVFTPLVYLEALSRLRLKSCICDIDDDMMIDTEMVKANLENGVKAIVLFHPLGNIPSDGEKYKELGLPIIEDITQSLGSLMDEQKPGNIGSVVIVSTEEDSIVSTAGGAIVLSNNNEIIENVKKESDVYIELPDMNASLGIVQLNKLAQIVERRRAIYNTYLSEARRKNRVKVFGKGDVNFLNNGYGFSVVTQMRPDEVIEEAKKYSVTVRKTFSKAVGKDYQDRYDKFPLAFEYLSRAVSFPLYPFLSPSEIQTVQKVVGILR